MALFHSVRGVPFIWEPPMALWVYITYYVLVEKMQCRFSCGNGVSQCCSFLAAVQWSS